MTAAAARIAAAFRAACRAELEAPKPGNVHAFADGHRMTAADFRRSADAAAPALAASGARVGARILGAVAATLEAVGANTNLGIVLLAAPLAAAAEAGPGDLRPAVARVLDDLDIEDARLAFGAIVRAAPGGLGRSPRHDVSVPPTVTLKAAMAEAAGRDRIAFQYVSAFADVFTTGLPVLLAGRNRWRDPRWATLALHLGFLSRFPDSHVLRNKGAATAETVRAAAAAVDRRLQASADPRELLTEVLAWDAALKAEGINPGTSADLTVATLFAAYLTKLLPLPPNSG